MAVFRQRSRTSIGRITGHAGERGSKSAFTKVQQAALAEAVLLIDTREQNPFKFAGSGLHIKFETLAAGDYSIEGFVSQIAIERKSLGDFLGSIGAGRERFKRELEKLGSYERAAVVVEADFSHISGGQHPISRISPEAATATIAAIWIDYGIPVLCCASRQEAEKLTLRVLQRFFLKKRGLK
jgi:DNA excision repair protein ERCC-4